jgi:hypothetical protein
MADSPARQTPILQLSTKETREVIQIDGTSYRLRRFDDLSIVDGETVARDFADVVRFGEAATRRKVGVSRHAREESEQSYNRALLKVATAVVEAPARVLRALKPPQLAEIYKVFISLSLQTTAAVKALAAPRSRVNGSTASRSSRASTAATRSTGGPATP